MSGVFGVICLEIADRDEGVKIGSYEAGAFDVSDE